MVIDGINFFPDSQIFLDPGAVLVDTVSPINPLQATITIPFGLPNIKHKLYVNNGQDSNRVDIFVVRDVTLDPVSTVDANIIFSGAN